MTETTHRPDRKTAASFEQFLLDRRISMREYARKPQSQQEKLRQEHFGEYDSVVLADVIIHERTGKTVAVRIDEDQGSGVYLDFLRYEYPGLIVTMADHDRQPREWQQEASRNFVDRLLPKATVPNEGFRASTSGRPVSLASKKEFVATAAGARAAEKRAAAFREARSVVDQMEDLLAFQWLGTLGKVVVLVLIAFCITWGVFLAGKS